MPDGLRMSQGAEEAVGKLLRSLLESGSVAGVLSLGRTGENEEGITYSLYTDPEAFAPDGPARPLLPFMPGSGGAHLSRLMLQGPMPERVAAVLRPCELRAFIELVKLNQGSTENVLLVSSTCGGVYPLQDGVDGQLESKLPAYWEAVSSGDLPDGIRPTCKSCARFVPANADITVALLGESDIDSACTLFLNTEKAAELVGGIEGLQAASVSSEVETEAMQRSQETREAEREALFDSVETGMTGLVNTFGRCISCHACRTMCPVCYCNLCYFDTRSIEHPPQFYERELAKKGGLRVPSDTLFFQLGRMMHVGATCVACGMCTDVCPADIPVSTIFAKIASSVQATLGYEPGRDLDEQIPISVYQEQELAETAT